MKRKEIIENASRFAVENELLIPGASILLSVSAGKDSVFLIELMCFLREKYNLKLASFHLNHKTRGENSDLDEVFIKNYCEKKGVEFYSESFDFSTVKNGNFEEKAREVRYKLLEKYMMISASDYAATAHSASDNAETALFRLFKGTSLWGMCSIPMRRDCIIRPILNLSSKDIISYLTENNISWREDESNKDNSYSRNFIRNKIIPVANEKFETEESLNSFIKYSGRVYSLLIELLKEKVNMIEEDDRVIFINNEALNNEEILKHLVAHYIRIKFNQNISESILSEIYRKYINLKKTHSEIYRKDNIEIISSIYRDRDCIVIKNLDEHRNSFFYYHYNNELELLEKRGREQFWMIYECDYQYFLDHSSNGNYIFLGIDDDFTGLTVRNRRNGDVIETESGSVKIKKILIDYKFSPYQKDLVPIICINGTIAAVASSFVSTSLNRVCPNFHVSLNSKKILAIYCTEKIM